MRKYFDAKDFISLTFFKQGSTSFVGSLIEVLVDDIHRHQIVQHNEIFNYEVCIERISREQLFCSHRKRLSAFVYPWMR